MTIALKDNFFMNKKLIGLGGYKESGKDTFAEGFSKDSWAVLGMSQPLLEAVLTLDPYLPDLGMTTQEAFEDYSHDYVRLKAESPEFRRLLIALGTDVGRNLLGENIWVDKAQKSIERTWAEGKNAIITGIRFPNELEMIKKMGGTLIWIARAGMSAPSITHASETSVTSSDFDVTVENNTTMEALRAKAVYFE